MKKIVSLLVVCMLLVTTSVTCFAAPGYGEEYKGYTPSTTTKYTDVPADHWAYDAIIRSTDKKWFSGYPDGRFKPDGSITRAEALKVFVVFLGLELKPVTESSFYDVNPKEWYAPYIEAGKDLFPTHTTVQGKNPFQPDMPVTREDTIYALVKALGYDVDAKFIDESVLNMFEDQNSISKKLRSHFVIALENKLVSGFPDGTIRAQDSLTRAEFATLLYRGSFVGFNDSYKAVIDTVNLTPSISTEMTIGETITLSARAKYTDGSNKAYTELSPYIANGDNVIKLNGTTATALKEGTAVIKFNDSYLKNESLTVIVKKPTDAPVLKITDYDEFTQDASATIKGTVTDKSGSVDLTCNNKDVVVNDNGSFTTKISLSVGVNNIKFVAKNQYGTETVKSISIERQKEVTTITEKPQEDEPTITEKEETIVTEEPQKAECKFTNMWSELDTSWGDDEYFLHFNYDCSMDIKECGVIVWEGDYGELVVEQGEECWNESRVSLSKSGLYNGCVGSIGYDGKCYGLELDGKYTWKGYVVDKNGNTHTSEVKTFVFDGEGSRFLGTGSGDVSGSCGDNVTWKLSNELLTISGNGPMENYYEVEDVPWFDIKEHIKRVVIEKGVTTIGRSAFKECENLQSITIPNSVTKIDFYAFEGCSSLISIKIPDSVTTVESNVFVNCSSLTSVKLSSNMTNVAEHMFCYCDSLTNIVIPEGITTIKYEAFLSCDNLESITLPKSLEEIGIYVFDYCNNLTTVYYSGSENEWNNVKIGEGNNNLTSANIICNG